jgi:hypothetical protein
MALIGVPPDTGAPYHAVLSAAGVPSAANGSYSWTTNNPSMIQFDNPSASTVNVTVSGSGQATITVSYTTPCGAGTDSLTFVLTNDVTVVGFIDGSVITLPSGASSALVNALASNGLSCAATIESWVGAGLGILPPVPPVTSSVDQSYADAFLNSRTSNPYPPSIFINDSKAADFVASPALYRAYDRFKAYYESTPDGIWQASVVYLRRDVSLGMTPEPCLGQVVALGSQAASANNTRASSSGLAYQLVEGRIGTYGQEANTYLNHPEDIGFPSYSLATPYIWAAVEFDSNGNLVPFAQGTSQNNLQIFPTYWIYQFGSLVQSTTQAALGQFIPLDSTSSFVPPF